MSNKPTKPTSSGNPASRAEPRSSAVPAEVTATVAPRRQSHRTDVQTDPDARAALAATLTAPLTTVATAAATSAAMARTGVSGPATAQASVTKPEVATEAQAPPVSSAGASRQPGTRRRIRPKIHPGQVACWQLALALIAASAGRTWWIVALGTIPGVALVALTVAWRRDLWMYQWAFLRLGYAVRKPRFVPVGAMRGTIEIGDTDAAIIVRPDGLTALLEVGAPFDSLPHPSVLLEQDADLRKAEHQKSAAHGSDLRVRLLVQHDRSWIALTVPRTVDCSSDPELELLLANAIRRLMKRLRIRKMPVAPLPADELAEVLMRLTPDHAREEWNGLRLWTGHYRMHAIPPNLASFPTGAITITLSDDLDHALVLAPAGTPPGRGSVPLTGRQRSAFLSALP